MKIAPYPLCWPAGWPRTEHKDRPAYMGGKSPTWTNLMSRLNREMRLMDGAGFVLSSDRPLRHDGIPYAEPSTGEDPGAAIYFHRGETPYVFAQDLYQRLNDNVRSLCLAIEGLRQIERHGGDKIMERTFQGFEALPAPQDKPWWAETLELTGTFRLADAENAYRRIARRVHPDHPGGSDVAMRHLNDAIREARVRIG